VRVAALYDVHGNLPALEAVLADPRVSSADLVVSGGDVCAGPMPVECLEALVQRGAVFVRGNADRALEGWPAGRLGEEQIALLRSWPVSSVRECGAGPVTFCHGSPRSDDEILTRITPAEEIDEACGGAALVVCGHTHVQFDRVAGRTRLVNAGSVGRPYEGRTAAFWLLLEDGEPELTSTSYDVDRAVASIRATGYDEAEDMASVLLQPHSADEATTFFEATRRGS
jgi:predicted phosphodiesterase